MCRGRQVALAVLPLCALLLGGCKRQETYLPLKLGNRWIYEATLVDGNKAAQKFEAVRWVHAERKAGERSLFAVHVKLASVLEVEIWNQEGNALSQGINNAITVMKVVTSPPKRGTMSFINNLVALPNGVANQRIFFQVLGAETLNLPIGRVKTVHVRKTVQVAMEQGKSESTVDYWFTRYIGIVQEVRRSSDTTLTLRLMQYAIQ